VTNADYRIEWRPMAMEDLRAVVRYIGKEHPTRAKDFGEALRDKTRHLAQHPEMGRCGRPGLPGDVRELVVHPNYIVFYRVVAESRAVLVLRTKHAAQQLP
jgi:addiction module RelE/StbE family toxin